MTNLIPKTDQEGLRFPILAKHLLMQLLSAIRSLKFGIFLGNLVPTIFFTSPMQNFEITKLFGLNLPFPFGNILTFSFGFI